MNERREDVRSVAEITEAEIEELRGQRPERFDARKLHEMHKADISSIQNELESLQQQIRKDKHHQRRPREEEVIFNIAMTPPEPPVIRPLALHEALRKMGSMDVPLRFIGTGASPRSQDIQQPFTVEPGKSLWLVYAPAEAIEQLKNMKNEAGTNHPLGVCINSLLGDGYLNWQARDLDPARQEEHAVSFEPAITTESYREMVNSGLMPRFFLTQKVMSRYEHRALLQAAEHEEALLRGESPFDKETVLLNNEPSPEAELDIPAAHLGNAYADFRLREEGITPLTIAELIEMQAGVYKEVGE